LAGAQDEKNRRTVEARGPDMRIIARADLPGGVERAKMVFLEELEIEAEVE